MAFLWFVCGLFVGILTSLLSQGIYWYKVPVVGKHGKLNETIEVSALWSIIQVTSCCLSEAWGILHTFLILGGKQYYMLIGRYR